MKELIYQNNSNKYVRFVYSKITKKPFTECEYAKEIEMYG